MPDNNVFSLHERKQAKAAAEDEEYLTCFTCGGTWWITAVCISKSDNLVKAYDSTLICASCEGDYPDADS